MCVPTQATDVADIDGIGESSVYIPHHHVTTSPNDSWLPGMDHCGSGPGFWKRIHYGPENVQVKGRGTVSKSAVFVN